jgi:hypothetical protein
MVGNGGRLWQLLAASGLCLPAAMRGCPETPGFLTERHWGLGCGPAGSA